MVKVSSVYISMLQAPARLLPHVSCLMPCRSLEDIEDVRREVQIMHHLSGHENITKLRGAYEDRHHVHLVS